MFLGYLFAPFVSWFFAGCVKFTINSIQSRSLAWSQIGYGGLPSTHTTIVTTLVWLIGFREGVDHPAFGVAASLAFIVMLDAMSLRKYVGLHAAALNSLEVSQTRFRERVGHNPFEVGAGVLVGLGCAYALLKVT